MANISLANDMDMVEQQATSNQGYESGRESDEFDLIVADVDQGWRRGRHIAEDQIGEVAIVGDQDALFGNGPRED